MGANSAGWYPEEVNALNVKAFGGFAFLFIVMALALFLPAWSVQYWQGWLFLAVFFTPALVITLYLMKNDTALLARRVYAGPTAEKHTSEKIIQSLTSLMFAAMLIVPALDHRFHWSTVPLYLVLLGDALVLLAFAIIFFVYKQNTFTSGTIEVYEGQKVVSAGLYGLVRHPMYMGALFLFVGMSLGLGSWWDLLVFALVMPALIWRIFDEEKLLTKDLPGYAEYKNKVRYRLIPYIW